MANIEVGHACQWVKNYITETETALASGAKRIRTRSTEPFDWSTDFNTMLYGGRKQIFRSSKLEKIRRLSTAGEHTRVLE